jgi:hypothetical protein
VALGGINQSPTIYLAFSKYLNEVVIQEQGMSAIIDIEKAYDSLKRDSLCDIPIKLGIPKKLNQSSRV